MLLATYKSDAAETRLTQTRFSSQWRHKPNHNYTQGQTRSPQLFAANRIVHNFTDKIMKSEQQ
jgi:hypothetical protein